MTIFNPYINSNLFLPPPITTSAEFIPKKHIYMTYAEQKRQAKKRNNIRKRKRASK